jgi:hypothetical protein
MKQQRNRGVHCIRLVERSRYAALKRDTGWHWAWFAARVKDLDLD